MKCFLSTCHFTACDVARLFSHYRNVHGLCVGSELKCSYDNCPRVFLSFYRLKKHLEQHQFSEPECPEVDFGDQEFNFGGTGISVVDDGTDIKRFANLDKSLMRFLVLLAAKPNITSSNVQTVAENLCNLVDDFSDHAVAVVYRLCSALGIDAANAAVQEACNELQNAKQIVKGLDTAYKRNKWLEKNDYVVKPCQLVLGSREVQRFYRRKGTFCSVLEEDSYQLIFLDKLLGKVLENSIVDATLSSQRRSSECVFLKEFRDGAFFRDSQFLLKFPDCIILQFFIDAYETVNPLGSHTQTHKLEGLYCVIRNLPQHLLSKTCNIFLVGLWYASYAKRYGYNRILQPIFMQLQQLESDNGLAVNVNGETRAVHGILGLFSADNLGAHSLFGFVESFSANYPCRFCLAHKDEIQVKFLDTDFTRRTREHTDACVASLTDAEYNPSLTGIKTSSILNELSNFHCTVQSVVDCMHDVLEGVVPYELALILQSLIAKQAFTLDELNNALYHFNYCASDKNSQPPSVSLPKLRIQAAEAWCLIRNIPLVVGSKVHEDDEHWQLLLLLLSCLDLIFAPVISHGQVNMLRCLIQDHHSCFKHLYPAEKLLPKHHFLVHYPEFIRKFGPLSQYWCMRFEAKHRFGKEIASVVRNFKNICKTVADRTQMELAHSLLNNKLFVAEHEVVNCAPALLCTLDNDLAVCISEGIGLCHSDEVNIASAVLIGHYRFKPGSCAVMRSEEGCPVFGEVLVIVSVDGIIYFVCDEMQTVGYFEHFHAFEVELSDKPKLILKKSTDLKDHHPLCVHKVVSRSKEITLVAPRYKIL